MDTIEEENLFEIQPFKGPCSPLIAPCTPTILASKIGHRKRVAKIEGHHHLYWLLYKLIIVYFFSINQEI
jgi:hypothetical protein